MAAKTPASATVETSAGEISEASRSSSFAWSRVPQSSVVFAAGEFAYLRIVVGEGTCERQQN